MKLRPEGFEPPTHGFEGHCSVQLSYGRVKNAAFRYPTIPAGLRPTAADARMRRIMSTQESHRYAPAVAELLTERRLMPLGPGKPNEAMRPRLAALTTKDLFVSQSIRNGDEVDACLAGLWLYHDFLDESHALSQSLHSPGGSYWHGIMHRREPDFDNAKYWFRRVGRHPVFEPLRQAAAALATSQELDAAAKFLATQSAWDPFRFVDLCEAAVEPSIGRISNPSEP